MCLFTVISYMNTIHKTLLEFVQQETLILSS